MKGMKSMKPIKTRRNEHMTTKEQLEERLRNLEERLHGPIATADERATILDRIDTVKDELKNMCQGAHC